MSTTKASISKNEGDSIDLVAEIRVASYIDDLMNQIIRKVRAQTVFDGMARELTPYVTEALALFNPSKEEISPSTRIMATGSLAEGTNLNRIDLENEPQWNFNRQVDYIIGIVQSGLYCVKPERIKELTAQAIAEVPQESENLITERFTKFVELLCAYSPFQISQENLELIDRIIPEEFSYDADQQTTNSDRRRILRIARILFLINADEAGTTMPRADLAEFFNKNFSNVIEAALLYEEKDPATFSPKSKEEETAFFIALNRFIDETIIENFFMQAIKKFLPRASKLIDFREIKVSDTGSSSDDFIEDHRHQTVLQQLEHELEQGAKSQVGGRDYARFRFPESIMKRAALGLIEVAVIDGTKDEAERIVIENFLKDGGKILAVDVCGQYGDFSKTLYKHETAAGEKKMLFVIAQRGEDRVLSNAAALLLYTPKKDLDGNSPLGRTRIPLESLHLFYRKKPLNEEIGSEIDTLLDDMEKSKDDDHHFFGPIEKTVAMPATSMATILQGLEELEKIDKCAYILLKKEYILPTLGRTFVVIVRDPKTGQLTRVLIPAVGGAGLYGDTAGIFVEEYLKRVHKREHLKLSKSIKFFGAAGAIKTEHYDLKEAQLATPTGAFIAYNKSTEIKIPRRPIKIDGIRTYWDHSRAPCPAIETDIGLQSLLSDRTLKVGMIDVESLPIALAISQHNQHFSQDPSWFNPVYYVSDNIDPHRPIPEHGHDYDSYAYGCRIGMALHLSDEQLRSLVSYIVA